MYKNVGERIKYLREENHITQRELGVCLNIDTSGISRMETNRRPLNDTTIIKLAQFFHTSSDYILCLSNQKENPHTRLTSTEGKFLQLLRQLSPAEQQAVMTIMEEIQRLSHSNTPAGRK